MNIELLTEHHLEFLSLKEGSTGSSESTLVKMPHSWKSHVAAHLEDSSYHLKFSYQLVADPKERFSCNKSPGLKVIRKYPYSTQLSTKFILLIIVKMLAF